MVPIFPTSHFLPCASDDAALSALHQPFTVLTVDDDPITTGLLTSLMRKNHILADSCDSGQSMWEKLDQCTPRIIMLDVEMPGDDGFTLAEQLRARYGLSVVIIMLTSLSRGVDIAMGLDCGADDYLTKPCNWPMVLDTIRKYMD